MKLIIETKEKKINVTEITIVLFISSIIIFFMILNTTYEIGKAVNYEYMVDNNCRELISENSDYLDYSIPLNILRYNATRKNISDEDWLLNVSFK